MAKGRDNDQVMGRGAPGETEGGRRPTGVSPGETRGGAAGTGTTLDCSQKTRGGAPPLPGRAPGSGFPGVGSRALPAWSNGGRTPWRAWKRPSRPDGDPLKAELDTAMQRIGELTMENELLWVRVRRPGPLAKRRSKK